MASLGQASSRPPEHLPEGGQVLRIPHWGVQTSSPGHIDIEALTAASSHLENRRQERREESRESPKRGIPGCQCCKTSSSSLFTSRWRN